MKYFLIILYLIFLIFFYIIIKKRLRTLNEKHMRHIGSRCLIKNFFAVKRIVFVLLVILFFLSSLLILTIL